MPSQLGQKKEENPDGERLLFSDVGDLWKKERLKKEDCSISQGEGTGFETELPLLHDPRSTRISGFTFPQAHPFLTTNLSLRSPHSFPLRPTSSDLLHYRPNIDTLGPFIHLVTSRQPLPSCASSLWLCPTSLRSIISDSTNKPRLSLWLALGITSRSNAAWPFQPPFRPSGQRYQ